MDANMVNSNTVNGIMLIGAQKNGNLLFAELNIIENELWTEFHAVRPIGNINEVLTEYYDNYFETLPVQEKYNLCESYDCAPSMVPLNMAQDCHNVYEVIDGGILQGSITAHDTEWYFRAEDAEIEQMDVLTDESVFPLLLRANEILTENEIIALAKALEKYDSECEECSSWISEYITGHWFLYNK